MDEIEGVGRDWREKRGKNDKMERDGEQQLGDYDSQVTSLSMLQFPCSLARSMLTGYSLRWTLAVRRDPQCSFHLDN